LNVRHSPSCDVAAKLLTEHHRELNLAAHDNDPERYRLALTDYCANFNILKFIVYPECPG